ncbi:hypothetical protein J1N35_006106 [Gossypium stocksii]|uniref:Uncharacterized protein n=1 Tax=Gossypium stocksii TaxID=47602 RepID=A0A9D4AJY5_9ROSI|nr:hypothetical protein J1N35_006106 [Gossypium stocksii]
MTWMLRRQTNPNIAEYARHRTTTDLLAQIVFTVPVNLLVMSDWKMMNGYRKLRPRIHDSGYFPDHRIVPYLNAVRFGTITLIEIFDLRFQSYRGLQLGFCNFGNVISRALSGDKAKHERHWQLLPSVVVVGNVSDAISGINEPSTTYVATC